MCVNTTVNIDVKLLQETLLNVHLKKKNLYNVKWINLDSLHFNI